MRTLTTSCHSLSMEKANTTRLEDWVETVP
ncbi:hypothetical protein TELCIR_25537 [Teladorsagia circumcincta]|uniref:Uncharacterized protein n=1 Tax=Teladorsagia circumcincta TaxID=45464 RepID=A0A2G9T5B7_TELCI|nr:hypothetical protein TELCIR_25537 [Teladorsagia circumcincta]